jgi:hypothetical protein
MSIVRIEGTVKVRSFRAKGGNWVGVCDQLAITVQSDTWAHLLEDIGLTINAMFIDLTESNELEPFLREHDWKRGDDIPTQSAGVWFDLPFVPTPAARDTEVEVH